MEKPKIEIDKYAIRFKYGIGGHNLFWRDFFCDNLRRSGVSFQSEIMEHLFKMYNQCVKDDIEPESDKKGEDIVLGDVIDDFE